METNTAPETNIIDRAKQALVAKPKATKVTEKAVEAADAIIANELLAERQAIVDAMKSLEARKKAIDAIIKDAIGNNDTLTVHGAVVASIVRWRQTDLNTEFIKENFKPADYPEMFIRSDKSRLDVKK